MADQVNVNPVSRVGGHLSVELTVENGKVSDAKISGNSVRGFERILSGKHPGDMTFITQRICSESHVANAVASAKALEDAWGVQVPSNARIIRNIMLAASTVSNHIGWFYHRALADYIDFNALSSYAGNDRDLISLREQFKELSSRGEGHPFLPQPAGDYHAEPVAVATLFSHSLDAYAARRNADAIVAVLAGRSPMGCSVVPGGVTSPPDAPMVSALLGRIRELSVWVKERLIADALALVPEIVRFADLGIGVPNFMSLGAYPLDNRDNDKFMPRGIITGGDVSIVEDLAFERIEEHVSASRYTIETGKRHPSVGETEFSPAREGTYSFVKAPRYDGRPVETGPLARLLVKQDPTLLGLRKKLNIGQSVLARMIARSVEAGLLTTAMQDWLGELRLDEPAMAEEVTPRSRDGFGSSEGADGSLGHWIRMEEGKVASFQAVSGSTWNLSPRDDVGKRGPVEEALIGTPVTDLTNPLDALRVIRSFDPCVYCATH